MDSSANAAAANYTTAAISLIGYAMLFFGGHLTPDQKHAVAGATPLLVLFGTGIYRHFHNKGVAEKQQLKDVLVANSIPVPTTSAAK